MLGAYGGSSPWHRQTSFLLDGTVSLDAGALTQSLTLEEQARVRSIILTHSHLDHVASLPFLVENVFGRTSGGDPLAALAAREHRHAQHRYRLEQFGLEAGDVRDELSRWTVDAEPLAA